MFRSLSHVCFFADHTGQLCNDIGKDQKKKVHDLRGILPKFCLLCFSLVNCYSHNFTKKAWHISR